jgi:hypothetical protein
MAIGLITTALFILAMRLMMDFSKAQKFYFPLFATSAKSKLRPRIGSPDDFDSKFGSYQPHIAFTTYRLLDSIFVSVIKPETPVGGEVHHPFSCRAPNKFVAVRVLYSILSANSELAIRILSGQCSPGKVSR